MKARLVVIARVGALLYATVSGFDGWNDANGSLCRLYGSDDLRDWCGLSRGARLMQVSPTYWLAYHAEKWLASE